MKKRIVFFVNSLTGGGAEKVLQTLLNGWEGRGWDISVYCLKKEDVPPGYPGTLPSVFCLFPEERGRVLDAPESQGGKQAEAAGIQALPSAGLLPHVCPRNL